MNRSVLNISLSLLATLAMFSHPSTAFAGRTGNVTGYVVDGTKGTALPGATITSGGKTATSDSSGHYTLSSLSTGTQTVTGSKTYYVTGSVSVSVVRGITVTAPTLKLAENWGSISGTVTNAATGAAISGATVTVAGLTTQTSSTGTFAFSQVTAGSEKVTASASSFASNSQTVTVPVGGSVVANVALQASVTLGPTSTIPWNGKNTYWLGNDYAWYNYGTDFGTGGWGKYTDWTSVNADFAAMHSQGVHIVRWWVFADGRYSPDFNSDGTVLGLDSDVLPNIDTALQIAANNQINLLFCVMDSSMWSAAQYSGSVQEGGHAAIVTSATVQQTYLDNALKPLLQHIAGSPYRTQVAGYDLVNEPESQMSSFWGGSKLATSAVQSFVASCVNYVHTYSGGAYATLGSASPKYVSTWKGLGLDLYQIHYYPWMDNGGPAGSGLPTYASLGLDKPCIVGEFPTQDGSYGLTDTTALSAEWYLNTIYSDGYAGALGWSYHVGDSASNWTSFQPVYSNWNTNHAAYVGP